MMRQVKAVLEVLLATLREIFDENAYARYLARTGTTVSRDSYGAFLAERRAAELRRVRCC
jgi:S-adenosylmethionine:diacylglycerol 3-amino-3-carboxypropyl transferase